MKDRLDEYLDGLLTEAERREVERALAADAALRAELERTRRFAGLIEGLDPDVAAVREAVRRARAQERRGRIVRLLLVAGAAAAAALAVAVSWPREDPHAREVFGDIERQSLQFGARLGAIAEERRQGRIPRTGVGDLEIPPAAAYGIVFQGALDRLGIGLDPDVEREVKDLVKRHYLGASRQGRDLKAERARAESALALYRDLKEAAGAPVADAWYDVFRPGIADLETARRLRPGQLELVVADHARYQAAFQGALEELNRRFGETRVRAVLEHLAPRDRRTRFRDPAQEGVGRGAVLEIRARLYEAAEQGGADKLYVEG